MDVGCGVVVRGRGRGDEKARVTEPRLNWHGALRITGSAALSFFGYARGCKVMEICTVVVSTNQTFATTHGVVVVAIAVSQSANIAFAVLAVVGSAFSGRRTNWCANTTVVVGQTTLCNKWWLGAV